MQKTSYSRYMFCQIVFNQEVKTFIRCHEHAFRYFSGVPKTVKIDNLKAAILEANFYEPIYQKEYEQFSRYYNFSSIPCRVRTPTDKAKIESSVKYVKNNFFKGRKYKTYDEYEKALNIWLNDICNSRIHGTTKKIPKDIFEAEERIKLNPLPANEYDLSIWVVRKVATNCHINYECNFYSVPYAFVDKEVTLQICDKVIRIYGDNELLATHLRLKGKGQYSTNAAHYPEYKTKTKTEYQASYRKKMEAIGSNALEFFDKLLVKNPQYWGKPIYGILKLRNKYSDEIIDAACKRAIASDSLKYHTIKTICEKGLYNLPIEESTSMLTTELPNEIVRPLSEYQELLKLKEVK